MASAVAEVECLRTLDRLRHRGDLTDRDVAGRLEAVYRLLDEVTVVEPTRRWVPDDRLSRGRLVV